MKHILELVLVTDFSFDKYTTWAIFSDIICYFSASLNHKRQAVFLHKRPDWKTVIDRVIARFTYVNLKECSATPSSQTSFSVLCFVNTSIYLARKVTKKPKSLFSLLTMYTFRIILLARIGR